MTASPESPQAVSWRIAAAFALRLARRALGAPPWLRVAAVVIAISGALLAALLVMQHAPDSPNLAGAVETSASVESLRPLPAPEDREEGEKTAAPSSPALDEAPVTPQPMGEADRLAAAPPEVAPAPPRTPGQPRPRAASKKTPSKKARARRPSLLNGLNIAPVAGTKRASAGGASVGLQATAIQRTVRKYSSTVRQNCWQPALNARAPGAPSSAKVRATVTVAATGRVQSVTASGAPRGYPGLARCIETAVRGWTFPRSDSETVTNVPFMFVGQ